MSVVLFCRHSTLVQHLKNENEWLRAQYWHERQRAERALDQLLQLKVPGTVPLTIPTPQEQREQDRLVSGPGDEEFDAIGRLDG